eukprot:gnl/TRDRNA2_/TRDRNA2_179190_c0_seq1.p1 gnl/TRDRNA2_/TRDRNA2_179190_c0~~gnl/TRDRNA2_/TRDRNA2_179190_c0_seq1.p1  ORF type:complete len:171 (+),score=35.04 gnl/TRDRNA2_/TRDRNA2_179190_c0_seq1:100-612(+)
MAFSMMRVAAIALVVSAAMCLEAEVKDHSEAKKKRTLHPEDNVKKLLHSRQEPGHSKAFLGLAAFPNGMQRVDTSNSLQFNFGTVVALLAVFGSISFYVGSALKEYKQSPSKDAQDFFWSLLLRSIYIEIVVLLITAIACSVRWTTGAIVFAPATTINGLFMFKYSDFQK